MAGQTSLSVAFAEHTTLPQLQLRDKKDVVQCSAFVNAFAVTREQGWYSRPNGSGRMRTMAYGLWYLSLLGEPGTGTTLQALYAGATELRSFAIAFPMISGSPQNIRSPASSQRACIATTSTRWSCWQCAGNGLCTWGKIGSLPRRINAMCPGRTRDSRCQNCARRRLAACIRFPPGTMA